MSDRDSTRDWRGTKIEIGDRVIYGGPVGKSIQMVEGEVVGWTEGGRVNVRIIRRSYSRAWIRDKRVVHVGPDRLTVLKGGVLPISALPTWEEAIDESKRATDERTANYASHTGPELEWYEADHRPGRQQRLLPCTTCGAVGALRGSQRCTGD